MATKKTKKQAPAAVAPTSPSTRAEVGGFEPHSSGGHRCTARGCGVVVSGPELREQLEAHRALHQG